MRDQAEDRRVVVVSNRLPVALKRIGDGWQTKRTAGGLATAMSPVLKQSNGIWIGWTGDVSNSSDEKRRLTIEQWSREHRYFGVDLDPQIAQGFYEGIANQVLWPLFHHFPSLMRFEEDEWNAYVKANETFRDEIVKHLRPNDLVWIHDYHLMLLPQMLREAVPDVAIGFFLHIPFPSSSVFRILPKREELLRGLLGADYLAFHTHRYLQNFRTTVLRLLGLGSQLDSIDVGRRGVKLEALPIGIAADQFNQLLLKHEGTRSELADLKGRFNYKKIILGVDRLDYTKGIPEKLRAYRRFLNENSNWRGKVVLIQVAVPSRERVPKYTSLRRQVDELVGEINGELSTPDWSPITYVRRSLPQSELAALYAAADVALVTPLRDGLNLVAKEYVACKSSGDGALVLSEFAGAAAEMGEALIVNPYDETGVSQAINKALSLSESERRERMMPLYQRVNKNNVFAWGQRFIGSLNDAARMKSARPLLRVKPLPVRDLVGAFTKSQSRLILLDYDGTLAPYTRLPKDAVPTHSLLRILEQLCGDPTSRVALVSGRSHVELESWFGRIPNLWLAAEHGSMLRSPLSPGWEKAEHHTSTSWKESVYAILEHFVDRTPGSFIEEKEFSLVWHFRMADSEFGDWLANDLVANLGHMLADSPVKAVKGQKTVEVKCIWTNKGQVYSQLTTDFEPDFIMAAGDDVTDEDLFAQLPASAWSIHVGKGNSSARYHLTEPQEMIDLLGDLLVASSARQSNTDLEGPKLSSQVIFTSRIAQGQIKDHEPRVA